MHLADWSSTKGTKYHIIGGMLAGLPVAVAPLLTAVVAYGFYKYQRYDEDCTDQQKAYDVLEIALGVLLGGYTGTTLVVILTAL